MYRVLSVGKDIDMANIWKKAIEKMGFKAIIKDGITRNSYGIFEVLNIYSNKNFTEDEREELRKQYLIIRYGTWEQVPQCYK